MYSGQNKLFWGDTRSEEGAPRRVKITNLPNNCGIHEIMNVFEPCGPIEGYALVRNVAFLQFTRNSSVIEALQKRDSVIRGRRIGVSKVKPKNDDSSSFRRRELPFSLIAEKPTSPPVIEVEPLIYIDEKTPDLAIKNARVTDPIISDLDIDPDDNSGIKSEISSKTNALLCHKCQYCNMMFVKHSEQLRHLMSLAHIRNKQSYELKKIKVDERIFKEILHPTNLKELCTLLNMNTQKDVTAMAKNKYFTIQTRLQTIIVTELIAILSTKATEHGLKEISENLRSKIKLSKIKEYSQV